MRGGHKIDLGRRSPWWRGRQEGAGHHHYCWSQFLAGFIHPVWWHPPDDGRQHGGGGGAGDHQQEQVRHTKGSRHHHRLGRRSPHPLPSSKPAGSREEVNNLAGGAWRGLEECWGIWENFRVTLESKSGGFTF